jgi:septal ring factor EnvC (AmiA/AmiB activator)
MKCAVCPEEATSEIRLESTSAVTSLCQTHAETTKRELDGKLLRYQLTSIAVLPATDAEQVQQLSEELAEAEEDNASARLRISELTAMVNERNHRIANLERELTKARQQAPTNPFPQQQPSPLVADARRLVGDLGQQRVEGSEVKPLPGVNAPPDAHGPTPKPEGGHKPTER